MADLGTLRTTISDRSQSNFSDSQIDTVINSVIDYYRKDHLWFNEDIAIITLNANDPIVPNVPSDFGQPIEPNGVIIRDSNISYPITKITPLEYDSIEVDGQGLPRFYTIRDNQILLYDFPDRAYELRLFYLKNYATLVNDTDTNDFTDNADRLLIAKSLSDLYRDFRQEPELYAVYELQVVDEYNQLMNETYDRVATGRLITENIVDRAQSYYWGSY